MVMQCDLDSSGRFLSLPKESGGGWVRGDSGEPVWECTIAGLLPATAYAFRCAGAAPCVALKQHITCFPDTACCFFRPSLKFNLVGTKPKTLMRGVGRNRFQSHFALFVVVVPFQPTMLLAAPPTVLPSSYELI